MELPNSASSTTSAPQVESASPKTVLSLFDAIALIVGVVIGAGILKHLH